MTVTTVDTLSAAAEARFQRSLAALAERFPDIAAVIPKDNTVSRAVLEDGEPIDIDLGQGRLYDGDGRILAREKTERFLEKPLRFYVNDLFSANLGSGVAMRMALALRDHCEAAMTGKLAAMPSHDGAFLFVLGVGLGYHLPDLVNKARSRDIMIFETHAEFLRHSLAAIDWEKLFKDADEAGREIHLHLMQDPEDILNCAARMISRRGSPMIDGSMVYLTYPSWQMRQVQERLWSVVDRAFISSGFFEDEKIMISNAIGNALAHPFRLLDSNPRLMRSEPVFIIGSGPSLDAALPHIKRLADRAIVFSCGTGLRACLSNGIVPDFHCELENGPEQYELLSLVRREHAFDGITLVASTTVQPRAVGLFDDIILYFRDSGTATRVLADEKMPILGASPTVANTALSAAALMGFTTIYLFGIDCGARTDGAAKHAKDSPYVTNEEWAKRDADYRYPLEVPGNFGGIARTDWLMDLSRRLLGEVIRLRQLKVFNCSDGAQVRGAVPRVPAKVRIDGPALNRSAIKATLLGRIKHHKAGQYLADFSLADFTADVIGMFDAWAAQLDEIEGGSRHLVDVYDRMAEFCESTRDDFSGASGLITASEITFIKIAMYFAHRMPDEDDRKSLLAAYFAEARAILSDMRKESLELLERLAAEFARPAVAAVN
jgi:Glycosyltransferase Maf N-terminal domain/Protein of unknown function DUF115